MGRANTEDNKLYDPIICNGLKFQPMIQTLGAAMTIDRDAPTMIMLDPGGATRIITLPAAERGLTFIINNIADAAEDLTINNPAAATVGTISQNEAGLVFSDGTNWYVRLVGTST